MKTLASIPSCCAPEFRLCLTSDGDSHDGDGGEDDGDVILSLTQGDHLPESG